MTDRDASRDHPVFGQHVETYRGYAIHYSRISYNVPAIRGAYGYRNDLEARRAITRHLAKVAKRGTP